jgi:hypothetical protein
MLMLMLMNLRFMGRMFVLMGTMLPGVFMRVLMGILPMRVFMGVLVQMFMGMGVGVLMRVKFVLMPVFMAVYVGMFMEVQMLMFVFPLHTLPPFLQHPGSAAKLAPSLRLPDLVDFAHQFGTRL